MNNPTQIANPRILMIGAGGVATVADRSES